jgi:hypothetical protein
MNNAEMKPSWNPRRMAAFPLRVPAFAFDRTILCV